MRAVAVMLVLLAFGCDEPLLLERTSTACRNGLDDDRDGDADCDDIDCAASGVCEVTLESCQNGLDDDGDGAADCEDLACVAHPDEPCADFVIERCDPVTGAPCPRGMTCAAGVEPGGAPAFECRLPGSIDEGRACDVDDDLCGPGLVCSIGFCSRGCVSDADCRAGSRCLTVARDPVVGFCSTPCTPFDAAESCAGEACVALHNFSFTFDEGGADFTCLNAVSADPFLGTGLEGAPCAERATNGGPREDRCGEGLVCVPEVDGSHVCRRGCTAAAGALGFGCADRPCHRCAPAYPLDPRREGDFGAGYCECDPGCGACE